MTHEDATLSTFEAALLRPALPAGEAQWGFVLLPKAASAVATEKKIEIKPGS